MYSKDRLKRNINRKEKCKEDYQLILSEKEQHNNAFTRKQSEKNV